MSDAVPNPKRLLDGRYDLRSEVGEGGAGKVWLAHDRELGITVAVKILHRELAKRELMRAKFDREAELSARMMSPNIVRTLARGIDSEGVAYIAYELLDGEDLADRLDRDTRLSFAETETAMVHVARALARAHGVGVIHRDIKPENIFVTKDEEGRLLFKVLDFGVAELAATMQARGADIAGTFEYMSPEVLLEGRVPDARSDLYALAVVAHRCLTGKVPFAGETMGEIMLAHANTKAPKVSDLCSAVGDDLDRWFSQALARDPTNRFQNAKAMAEAFHQAVKSSRPSIPSGPRAREEVALPPMRPRMQSFVFDAVEAEAFQYASVRADGEAPPPSIRRPSVQQPSVKIRESSQRVPSPRVPSAAPSTPRLAPASQRPAPAPPAPPSAPPAPESVRSPPPMRQRFVSAVEIDATSDDDAKEDARRR